MRHRLFGAVAVAAFALLSAPVYAQESASVSTQGGVTIISQPDSASNLVHATLIVRAGLDRETLAQNGLAALTAQTILETPVDGVPLTTDVAAHGGNVQVYVDPTDVRFAVEGLPQDAEAILSLVGRALAAPSFDAKTVGAARRDITDSIAANQDVALQVGLDMLSATTSQGANTGLPSLGVPAALAQLTPDDVKNFFHAFYRRGGTMVSAVGRLDALPQDALASFASTLPAGTSNVVSVNLPKLEGTSREIVAHRDVSAPWLIAQYSAPAVGSKDFGAMLVLAAFMQRTLADMAEVPGVVSPTFASRSVGAMYRYDRRNPNLTLYVNGGVGNPNRTFSTALSIASILATTKLEGSIDEFKALAAGDFTSGSMTLESRAWLAAVFVSKGLSPDYVTQTLTAISQTTGPDLQRVAKLYLGNPTIALVLPRDAQ